MDLSIILPTFEEAANVGSLIHPEKGVNRRIFVYLSSEEINKFSTDQHKSRDPELIYFSDSLMKDFLVRILFRESEIIFASGVYQASRQDQQVYTNRFQRHQTPAFGHTQTLEPVDQIVSQQDQMEVSLVGQKAVGGNAAQREAFLEFSDIQFAAGSGLVKMPYALWVQRKIGNKGMVKVIFELPERELIVFFSGFGAAHHDEAMRPLPVVRLVSKPGYLPPILSEGMMGLLRNALILQCQVF